MGTKRTKAKDASNKRIYDQVRIRVRKDGKDDITAAEIRELADLCGESVNSFVLQAIRERASQLRGW